MGKAKAGRKRKEGERDKNGKLKSCHDYGNERVQELIARFRPFQGGKADQWILTSSIGRVWAVGLLEGYGVDGAAIRDSGEKYYALHVSAPLNQHVRTGNYEGEDRRGGGGGDWRNPDPSGESLHHLDALMLTAGRAAYDAMRDLVTPSFIDPWIDTPWVDRLINLELAREFITRKDRGDATIDKHLKLPNIDGSDRDRLHAAVSALLTITAGKRRAA